VVNIRQIAEGVKKTAYAGDAVDTIPEQLNILGTGVARVVVEHPDDENKVIKFGAGRSGYLQNKSEYNIYRKAEQEGFDNLLVPVRNSASDFSYIVMDRVDCPPVGDGMTVGPKSSEILDALCDQGVDMYEIETAIVDGTPKAYDYGVVEGSDGYEQ
jgi:hypothetical protein